MKEKDTEFRKEKQEERRDRRREKQREERMRKEKEEKRNRERLIIEKDRQTDPHFFLSFLPSSFSF